MEQVVNVEITAVPLCASLFLAVRWKTVSGGTVQTPLQNPRNKGKKNIDKSVGFGVSLNKVYS